MTEDNDFEDWSHPTRSLSMPPRRHTPQYWQWMRMAIFLGGLALACGLFALFWHIGHIVAEAWRTLFAR
jgi:hypothetical protein